ncbi:hypothetical protein ABTX80_33270 [Streptomyces erythrochromogenes]|uniref:hypothetical protein n=1 Tax=Streptomyces erythrochromogenes TaxID=285574 RepID=UPI00331EB56D
MSEMIGSMREYETHVTVRCADAAEPVRLNTWAAARELEVTHVEPERGRAVWRPVLTLPDRTGHERLVPRLRADGFDPVRVEVTTVPWTRDLPGPGGGHFEHHLPVLLPADFDRTALEALAAPHGAHLSRSVRRVGGGYWQVRCVSQRWSGAAGAAGAGAAFDALVRELDSAGYEVDTGKRQFVLYDRDLSVDDGRLGQDVDA